MSEHRAREFREVRTLSRRLLALLLLSILLFGPHATRSTMASIGVVSSVPAAQAPPAESGTSQAGRWTMASLAEPHTGGTAVTVGNTVLFAGGATSGTPSDVVEIYDRSSGQWTRAALARGRVGPSTATVGTRLVVAGGRESSGEASRLVDLYDLASGEWSVATLHSPWFNREVIAVGTKALFPASAAVEVLDTLTGQITLAPLAEPRESVQVAVVGTHVVLAGGTTADGPSAAVDVYDSTTGAWTTARLTQPLAGRAVAVVGGRALFAGGALGAADSAAVDVYDAATNTWTMATLSEARRDVATAVVGTTVLFAGGRTPDSQGGWRPTVTVDVYDGATGVWSTAALSEPRQAVAAVAGSRAVFVSDAYRPSAGARRTIDVYDGTTGAWSTTELHAAPLFAPDYVFIRSPVDTRAGTVFASGSQVLFAGGAQSIRYGGGGQYVSYRPSDVVGIYDAATGQWSEAQLSGPSYTPVARGRGGVALLVGRDASAGQLNMAAASTLPVVSHTADFYDSATGEWTQVALPTPRRDMGVALLGDKAVFAGGRAQNPEGSRSTADSNAVDLYDGATGQWSTTTLPQPSNSQLVAVYAVGTQALFLTKERSSVYESTVYVYDVATRAWTEHTLPEGRSSQTVAVVNGQVLFAWSSGDVDVYDSGTGAWSVASLSDAHRRPAVAVVGTQALFAGGTVGSVGLSDVVDVYDSLTGAWSTATLSEARQDAAVAVVGSQVLFAGGIIERVQHTAAVDIYDSATGRWTAAALSQPRRDMTAVAVGARAVFLDENGADVYDTTTGAWTSAQLSQPRSRVAVVVVGSQALFAGGFGGGGASASVDLYDSRTGTWSTATLSEALMAPRGAAVVGSRALFAGAPSGRVDIYDSATGAWSTAALSVPRSGATGHTLGTRALFVGGVAGPPPRSDSDPMGLFTSDRVDIFEAPGPP